MQKVTHNEGEKLASEFGIKFFETSAKLNTNVDEAFASIAKDVVGRLKVNPEHYSPDNGENIVVNEQPTDSKQKSCCWLSDGSVEYLESFNSAAILFSCVATSVVHDTPIEHQTNYPKVLQQGP